MIDEPFIKLSRRVFLSDDLSYGAKLAYAVLVSHCFTKDSCYPGLNTISRETKMSVKKCKKSIDELIEMGFVKRQRRGQGLTNIYILCDNTFKSEYRKYLISPHWLKFKKEVLKFYGKKCCRCEETKKLNVHHLNYDCLGNETFNDVIVLCRSCHRKEHGID